MGVKSKYEHIEKMKDLIQELNNASIAYYTSTPIMSDYDWDKKYEELQMLENQENIIFPNSPTQNVGYTISDKLNEVKLDHLMLSLDKTKSINDLKQFAGNKQCIVSVKCDGLSTTLKYIHGELVSAVTRGNGYEGTDVLQNVLTIKNIPKKIPYYDELIIDGETIIGWDTFNKINERIKDTDKKYKHPRNLVSGSLLLLDSKEAAQRNITNCLLVLDKVTYNLHIDSSEMLLIKLNALLISAKDLEIDTSTLMISGSSLDDWIADVKANLEVQRYKDEKKKLDMLEKQLTALLSDDKQTELQIDSLEELLKDSE